MTYINNQRDERWKGYAIAGLAGGVLGTGEAVMVQHVTKNLEAKLKNPPSPSEVDSKFKWTNPIPKDSYTKSETIRAAKLNRLERGLVAMAVKSPKELSEAFDKGTLLELTDADIPKALEALQHKTPFAQRALRSSLMYAGILGLGYGVYDVFFRPKNKP